MLILLKTATASNHVIKFVRISQVRIHYYATGNIHVTQFVHAQMTCTNSHELDARTNFMIYGNWLVTVHEQIGHRLFLTPGSTSINYI